MGQGSCAVGVDLGFRAFGLYVKKRRFSTHARLAMCVVDCLIILLIGWLLP